MQLCPRTTPTAMVDPEDVAFSGIRAEDSLNRMLIQLLPAHASEARPTSAASTPVVVILVFEWFPELHQPWPRDRGLHGGVRFTLSSL